jgi:hypothetical protein
MKLIYMLLFSFLTSTALSDPLVINGKITEIGNTPDGTESFFVRTSGGTGACPDGTVIVFPLSISSEARLNRAYSLALTAYATGSEKVNISTLTAGNVNCRGAGYIQLH